MTDLAARTEARVFGPADLPTGSNRRVYIKYDSHAETQVREGRVLDSHYSKKGLLSERFPAVKMRITRRGVSNGGEVKFEDVSYVLAIPYKNLKDVQPI